MTSDVRLSDVCLSVAFIGPNSGIERPRKTEIGKEVDHVTRYTRRLIDSNNFAESLALMTVCALLGTTLALVAVW